MVSTHEDQHLNRFDISSTFICAVHRHSMYVGCGAPNLFGHVSITSICSLYSFLIHRNRMDSVFAHCEPRVKPQTICSRTILWESQIMWPIKAVTILFLVAKTIPISIEGNNGKQWSWYLWNRTFVASSSHYCMLFSVLHCCRLLFAKYSLKNNCLYQNAWKRFAVHRTLTLFKWRACVRVVKQFYEHFKLPENSVVCVCVGAIVSVSSEFRWGTRNVRAHTMKRFVFDLIWIIAFQLNGEKSAEWITAEGISFIFTGCCWTQINTSFHV